VLVESRGDHKWVLEIGTTYPDLNGYPIPAKKIYLVSLDTLDDEIEHAVAEMCALIDWSPALKDPKAPYVDYRSPSGDGVNIASNIYIRLKDDLPSAGIDLSDIKITLNNGTVDFDITPEFSIEGDPYEYVLKWTPPMLVYDTYD